jgi:RNA polymerase sigma-70 factor (ECF subfamily)
VAANQRNPEAAADLTLQKQNILTAVATLPDSQKEILFMAYFRGYSQSEMAEELDIPLGTVKTRVRSAMQKLRSLLIEDVEK